MRPTDRASSSDWEIYPVGCGVASAAGPEVTFGWLRGTPCHERIELALSGPQALTPGEQLAVLAGVLKRPLHYEPLSDEAARTRMATDTPAPIIEAFFRFYSEGEFDDSIVLDVVERILGRPPRTFADWARAHAHAFRSA